MREVIERAEKENGYCTAITARNELDALSCMHPNMRKVQYFMKSFEISQVSGHGNAGSLNNRQNYLNLFLV